MNITRLVFEYVCLSQRHKSNANYSYCYIQGGSIIVHLSDMIDKVFAFTTNGCNLWQLLNKNKDLFKIKDEFIA